MNRIMCAGMCALLALTAVLIAGCGGGGTSGTTTTTGVTLTPLSPAEFVYAANGRSNSISQYCVAVGGALIPLTPATVAAGIGPTVLATDPKGQFLYASNLTDSTLSQYRIGGDGTLTPLSPATVSVASTAPSNGGLSSLTEDASGRFLYAVNSSDNTLHVFTVSSSGALQSGRTIPNVTTSSFVVAHPQLSVLYTGGDTVSQFQIGSDGSLTPLSPATVQTPAGPGFLALTPNGKFAYLGFDGSTTPAQYQVNANGTLSVLDLASSTNTPGATSLPTIDPGSRFVYTIAGGTSGVVLLQDRIGTDGRLTPLTPSALQLGLTEFLSLAYDPSGQFIYVPGPTSNSLVGFLIGSNGTLSTLPMPTVQTGNVPVGVISTRSTLRRRAVQAALSAHAFVIVRRPLP